MKQQVPITCKSSKFKSETQPYVVKLPKSKGASKYCPKIQRVPGTLGTRANSSLEYHRIVVLLPVIHYKYPKELKVAGLKFYNTL